MKKVLLITLNNSGVGGIERSYEILNHYLNQQAIKSTIISKDAQDTKYKIPDITLLKILPEPLSTYLNFKLYIKGHADILEKSIIVSRWLPISYALVKKGFSHTFIPPCVSKDFFDGMITNINKSNKNFAIKYLKLIKWTITKWIYHYFENVVLSDNNTEVSVFSDNVKRNISQVHSLDRSINVIPPGIDNRYFYSLPDIDIKSARSNLRIDDDDFVILYVGRISSGKNIPLLLDTFNALNIEKKKLLLVGNGELQITENANIYCLGKKDLPQLASYYNMANVTVLPTLNEGFGQVLTESLGCGTPVIGFDHTKNAISEIVTTSLFGHKAKCCDSSNLASAIMLLYSQKDNYSSDRKKIEQIAKEKYSWQHLIQKITH